MARRSNAHPVPSTDRLNQIARQLASRLDEASDDSPLRRLIHQVSQQLESATHRRHEDREIAVMVSQLLVHARLVWLRADPALHRLAAEADIFPEASSPLGQLLRRAAAAALLDDGADAEWVVPEQLLAEIRDLSDFHTASSESFKSMIHPYDFDIWLESNDRKRRARLGVYFTPPALAAYIVRRVDSALRNEFGLQDGLADTTNWSEMAERFPSLADVAAGCGHEPFVRILDPALGTGIFLSAVIDVIHETFRNKWNSAALDANQSSVAWSDYVRQFLLPRMFGIELMLPTAAVAWLRLAEKLAVTGCRWNSSTPFCLNVHVADTLVGTTDDLPLWARAPDRRDWESQEKVNHLPFTVVLGNPPFSALSTNGQAWIEGLLRRRELGGRTVGGYYEVDGKPLGEKKLWLHDDYVKFIRYAQWQIERAGCGIVGFVTNHGYLDNVTFRGMRRSLLATFPLVSVLDLHGNRKKHERSEAGPRDENVFGIEQGVAVGLFRRPPAPAETQIQYSDLWGQRATKLSTLADTTLSTATQPLAPAPPYYFFVPSTLSDELRAEYERGYLLTDIMPVYTSAVVTARDALVIAFSREELIERFRVFCDPALTDLEIRERLLDTTRSSRYPTGDTRGWKLHAAREMTRRAGDLTQFMRTIQYRPFDRRVILWADWLIDWPRSPVSRHMISANNLALVTRRQMLPAQPCNYFFVSDTAVIDGLIRSDNRGNESFFPLYLASSVDAGGDVSAPRPVNLLPSFIAHCESNWRLKWFAAGPGDLTESFGPDDLFALFYAQFFSADYRDRYASLLRLNFPRIFLPRDPLLLAALCRLGRQLIESHLLPGREEIPRLADDKGELPSSHRDQLDQASVVVQGRYPYLDGNGVRVAENIHITDSAAEAWAYRVGCHQVCRKWLRDRRGRPLTATDLTEYQNIVRAISTTLAIEREIDRTIDAAGGWPDAFVGGEPQ